MKTSYFCKGKVEPRLVEFDGRWKDSRVIIQGVPAEVCTQCGEQYFAPEVSRRLEEIAKQASHLDEPFVLVPVRAYGEMVRM